jgi:hypothetical protein
MRRYRVELFYLYIPCGKGEFTQIIRQHEIPCYDIIQRQPENSIDFIYELNFIILSELHLIDAEEYTLCILGRYFVSKIKVYKYNSFCVTWLPRRVLGDTS